MAAFHPVSSNRFESINTRLRRDFITSHITVFFRRGGHSGGQNGGQKNNTARNGQMPIKIDLEGRRRVGDLFRIRRQAGIELLIFLGILQLKIKCSFSHPQSGQRAVPLWHPKAGHGKPTDAME